MVGPDKPSPDEPHGEWRSMGESNVLLSKHPPPGPASQPTHRFSRPGARFGARHRPYVLHEAKSVSLSFLREITMMWPDAIAAAGSHTFRETVSGQGDASMLFLLSHFVVERWREALLWSWVVAKHGSIGDEWSAQTMQAAWAELGAGEEQREFEVRAGWRETIEDRRTKAFLRASGHTHSDKTQYRFCKLCCLLCLLYPSLIVVIKRHWTATHTTTSPSTTTMSGLASVLRPLKTSCLCARFPTTNASPTADRPSHAQQTCSQTLLSASRSVATVVSVLRILRNFDARDVDGTGSSGTSARARQRRSRSECIPSAATSRSLGRPGVHDVRGRRHPSPSHCRKVGRRALRPALRDGGVQGNECARLDAQAATAVPVCHRYVHKSSDCSSTLNPL